MIPNRFPVQEDQEVADQKKKSSGFQLSDINWRGIIILIVLVFVFLVAWIVIQELSGLGGDFGSVVMGWLKGASINPENRQGFTRLLKLILTGGFFGLLLFILNKK